MASAGISLWQDSFAALQRVAELADDWDGEGAMAPKPPIVANARQTLEHLQELDLLTPSRIAAGPNGAIVIEWQHPSGYFEIEVAGSERIEWMMIRPHSVPVHGEELATFLPHLTAALAS